MPYKFCERIFVLGVLYLCSIFLKSFIIISVGCHIYVFQMTQSMMKWCVWVLLLLGMVGFVSMSKGANGCNKAICASVVSKCMLIKSCECDMTNKRNCTCCKDCHMCLAKHYLHCCSCVGKWIGHKSNPLTAISSKSNCLQSKPI